MEIAQSRFTDSEERVKMQLISFNEKQIKEVLNLVGVGTDYPIIGNCENCEKDLKLKDIGMIAKGKEKPELYCDNPACCAVKCAEEIKFSQRKE